MPFQPIDSLGRSGFGGALGINMENATAYREKRQRDLASGRIPPGGVMLGGAWDAFYGGLMRQDEDAAAKGMRSRVDLSGIGNTVSTEIGGTMPSALRSLQRRAQPADEGFDPTEYQMGRAELERTLQDNLSRRIAQHSQENAIGRHDDPSLRLQDEQRERESTSLDRVAKDTDDSASFRRMEPIRSLVRREQRMGAEEMLPFNPAVLQSRYKLEGIDDTNDAKRDVATTAAGARTGSAAINSLARAAGSLTTGDPVAEKRVGDAIGAIQPNVPGQQGNLRPLPPEWDYALVVDKFGGNAKAADEWLALHGYRR